MAKTSDLIRQETRFTGRYAETVLTTLLSSYRPYRLTILLSLFIGFLGRALLLANANVIGYWVDSFCQPSPSMACRPLPSFLQGLMPTDYFKILTTMTLVGFTCTLLFRIWFSRASAKAVSQMYDETVLRTSRFPMSFFDTTPTGRVVTRFSSDYGNVFRLFGGPLAEFIQIIFDLTSTVILATLASPFYLLVILVVGVFYLGIYRRHQGRLREARRELSASRGPSIAHFAETAQGASSIRAFNKQKTFSERFSKLDFYFLQQKKRTIRNIIQFSLQMNGLTATLLLLTGSGAFFLVQRGWVSVGSIGVAFGFIALAGNSVQMFFEWLAQFEEAMIGVERLDHYLRHSLEPGARLPSHATFPTDHWTYSAAEDASPSRRDLVPDVAAPVRFQDVWFRYSENLPFVLKGLNFEVKAGEKFGVVGRTGSGKSSLIQALFYLYPLSQGEIHVAQQKPQLHPQDKGADLETYRRALSFIAQDPVLFKGPLRDNLDVDRRYNEAELFSVLRRVGLEKWATPEGLQLVIEEKGRNISLGEKQLLCMARCLLQAAPVVVMDEATSSVDPHSEEILVKATHEFFEGRTQIIIAHRLSTLKKCDRILWLHDGEIRMIGTPDEVLPVFGKSNLSFEHPMVKPSHAPRD